VTTLEKQTAIKECWLNAHPHLAPRCVIDDGVHNPPWLKEGDPYWYYDFVDGTLELSGLRIPLTTRWILCPEHVHFAQDELA
jgi:hypothetical protein